MKQTRLIMGMPITIEIVDTGVTGEPFEKIFSYFYSVDRKFSTYKKTSEITRINDGLLKEPDWSEDMKTVFRLSDETRKLTGGYFNIRRPDGRIDPSGLVKGWAIKQASDLLKKEGYVNFFVEAGGDIQVSGKNSRGGLWQIGIRNPFKKEEIVKVLHIENKGVATSGTYVRGQHIYNPFTGNLPLTDIVSLTVVGLDIFETDRFATAAFAMGRAGIEFIEQLSGFEGYMIDSQGIAISTSGFESLTRHHAYADR